LLASTPEAKIRERLRPAVPLQDVERIRHAPVGCIGHLRIPAVQPPALALSLLLFASLTDEFQKSSVIGLVPESTNAKGRPAGPGKVVSRFKPKLWKMVATTSFGATGLSAG
jgi:hypothetical protein